MTNEKLAHLLSNGLQDMSIDLSSETQQRLLNYLNLLQKWNKTYNLTAVTEPSEMIIRHLFDSLAVLPYLGDASPVLDVGTGAGLPGLVLGIARPLQQFFLLDSLGKRTLFLEKVARDLKLSNITIINSRVEQYHSEISFAVFTSRAFSSLRSFIDSTKHLSDEKTIYLAFKGRYPLDEIASVQTDVINLQAHEVHIPGLNAERHIIQFKRRVSSCRIALSP
ncbi:MAG: 16S rRNA (guanine(527)-N(7))-methyltransferase RsmG [Legionellales bacterium]|nr:16S rRNA (guanine(527)-N(7))-methyltransferase RsmG [Legionellales bacterium]